MSDNEVDQPELAKWDPVFTKRIVGVIAPVFRRWFRAEVRGLDSFPPTGGVLLVSNHSGGVLTPDPLILLPAFYEKFGYDRPLYSLAHYGVFITPMREYLGRLGAIHASPENATKALHSGGVVLDFPGGDYDSVRPTVTQNVSTSRAAQATSGPPSRPTYRSCLRCRSGGRRPSFFSPAERGWRSDWACRASG